MSFIKKINNIQLVNDYSKWPLKCKKKSPPNFNRWINIDSLIYHIGYSFDEFQLGMSPWWPWLGLQNWYLLIYSSHCNSFEDCISEDLIYEYVIFKWVIGYDYLAYMDCMDPDVHCLEKVDKINHSLASIEFLLSSPTTGHQGDNAWYPNSKVHGANMGPIWGQQDPGGPHVGPMNFAIRNCFADSLYASQLLIDICE